MLDAIEGGDGIPPEPDWLSLYTDELDISASQAEWRIVINELRESGTLSVANGHAIKRLVEFRVQYERAARQIAGFGPVLKAKRTGVPQVSPHWSIMRQADEAVRTIEAELGIPPVRRGKAAKVEKKTKKARPSDAYLKPVARA